MKRLLTIALVALSLLAPALAMAADKPVVYEGSLKQLPAATALQLNAPTTGSAAANLPAGTAPSSPIDGDIWTTSSGLFYRMGGATYGPLTLSSVTCGTPLTGGTITTTGTCGIATNGLALSYLAQIGGSSYLGNQSTTTGNVTAYAWPTCTNDGAHALVSLPSATPPIQCIAIGGVATGSNPFFIGVPDIKTGVGVPAVSTDPVGSLYLRTDTAEIYQQYVASGQVPALVQTATSANSTSATFSATPASGDLLVAICSGYVSVPGTATGWTDSGVGAGVSANTPGDRILYKFAVTGESTTQTPCTSTSPNGQGLALYEISGVPNWTASYETATYGTSSPLTLSTGNASDLVLGAAYAQNSFSTDPGAITTSGLTGGISTAHGCCSSGGTGFATAAAGQSFASLGSSISFTRSTGQASRLLVLKPSTAGWQRLGNIINLKSGGTTITSRPISINFSTGLSASDDGLGNTTVTATAVGANPTATAGSTAVNGSATTFMRSDAAPALPVGSSSTAGIVKVDGTTITASGGVISAVGGSGTVTVSGTPTTGNCVKFAGSTVITDAGATCGSGGGGGTTNNYYAGALQLIQTQTLSSTAASVTFSSIPQGYTDLVLVENGASGGATTFDQVKINFNGDTTAANYQSDQISANGSSASGGALNSNGITNAGFVAGGYFPGTSSTYSNDSGSAIVDVLNYANTSFRKTAITHDWVRGSTSPPTNTYIQSYSSWWESTAAITSLTLTPTTGPFKAGSTFSLYGRGGSNVTATAPSMTPQGRLTLTSGSPVMTADATAQTTLYYAPYVGNLLTVGGVPYTFSQISFALNTTAHVSGNLYDVFAYNNAGTPALCTGPAWTNSTTRSAAISQSSTFGLWVNTASLTCTLTGSTTTTSIGVGSATYLGTFYATANGQTGVQYRPSAASGGSNTVVGLDNAYNQVRQGHRSQDNNSSWTYSSATWRAMDGSNSNRVTFVVGLSRDIQAQSNGRHSTGVSTAAAWGMNLDSTTATPAVVAEVQTNATSNLTVSTAVTEVYQAVAGLHYVQEMEATTVGSGAAQSWNDTPPAHQLLVDYMNGLWLLPMRRRPANDNLKRRQPRSARA